MTFEGKPLHEKTAKAEPKAEVKAEVKPVAPPRKTHRFRNFLLTSLTLGTIVYVGGAYYALENEDVHDLYVDLPFGEDIIGRLERQKFQSRLDTISQLASINARNGKRNGDYASVVASGNNVVAKSVNAVVLSGNDQSITKSGPHLSALIPEHQSSGSSATSALKAEIPAEATTPASTGLPLIPIPHDIDPLVANSIHSFNSLISSVNESKHSKAHIDRISKELDLLTKSIKEIKNTYKAELNSKLQEETDKAGRLVEARTNELRTAVAAQEEKWDREFHAEQQRLAQSYNDRLQTEMAATNKANLAAANNKLLAAHVARQKQFAGDLSKRVDEERNSRVAKLEQLAKDLAEIEELTSKAEKVIIESDNAAQLHIAIARLKSVLESNKAVALGPYINAIKSTAGSDPLLTAAIESLPPSVYEEGVLTPAQLAARFRLLEPEIRKASLLPPNAGVAGHVGSVIFSKLLWKKSGNASGDDVESILSRTETALSEGRIVEAVGEINTLKGWPKRLAHDWLVEGRKRSEVEFLVDVVAEEGKLWGLEL